MKQFVLEQSKKEFYTSHSGLALVGLCLNKFCSLPAKARNTFPVSSGGIGLDDIIRSYVGLLTIGESDFEAITDCHDDDHFSQSLGVGRVPSAETLRQRLDEVAPDLLRIADACSVDFLKKARGPSRPWIQGISRWTAMFSAWTTPRPRRKAYPASIPAMTDMLPLQGIWEARVVSRIGTASGKPT